MNTRINRRAVLGGLVGGAVSLALAPRAFAQFGPAPGIIKLRANENPYGPSPKALEAAAKAAAKGAYYPDSIQQKLLTVIGNRHELTLDHMIMSSGSNEGLCAAAMAFGRKGRMLAPELTYSNHISYAQRLGVEMVRVPLKDDMSIDLEAMEAAVDDSISIVYMCNPNNPTGMTIDGDVLRAFCRSVSRKAVVLVDEAYNELTDDPDYTSMIDLVREGENVIVMRTFSKIFGMAGMRLGYGMAPPELAEIVRNNVMAWPNVVAMAAGMASYKDDEFIAFSREKILEGRKIVVDTFRRNGIEPLPSQTNFIYADIGRNATDFARQMAERKIHIRSIYQPYETYSRVSMGKIEELEVFSEVFDEVYAAGA